jgi:hypothetical protein
MTDLSMPSGLSTEERREWLRNKAAELSEATGQSSGITDHFTNSDGEESWIMWWSEEQYEPTSDSER